MHLDLDQEHDEMDKAVKQATTIAEITDPILSPISDLKSFYRLISYT